MPVALVTGANRGIGLALSRQLAERGYRVIAVCRACSAELEALDVRIERDIDVRERASLDQLAARLDGERLDLVVLNAGVLSDEHIGALDDAAFDRIRLQFEVNALGPLRCVEALSARIADGATIGLVTSRMGSLADNTSGGYYGYRMSKAALNAAGRSLAHDLAPRRIRVLLLHPGYVQTDMTGRRGDVSPDQAAAGLISQLTGAADSGSFRHANGSELPW